MRTSASSMAFVAVLLAACAAQDEIVELRGATMGTTFVVKFVGPAERQSAAARDVRRVLEEVEDLFSTYRENSAISRFNASGEGRPVEVGEEFVRVLREALEIAERSGGAFDPTVMPLVRLYGFGPDHEREQPSAEAIAAARAVVGYRKVALGPGPGEVKKLAAGVELDLSAIAKGHGVDRVSAELSRLGYPDHMVEIGGEVFCSGHKPGGESWRIAVEQPDGGGARGFAEVVELAGAALATSGDYRNYFEADGARVHHILDPRTGVNAPNPVASVSVRAPTCALADGLATALMVLGPEQAKPLLEAYAARNVGALFFVRDDDGTVTTRAIRWDRR